VSGGTDITFLVAVAAGLLSFLSPCVLPLVPAYIGQLTAVAVASSEAGATPSRWTSLRHAAAFVLGFGVVFGILGLTATFAAGPLVDYIPFLRQLGGVVLIVLGLSLAGILRIPIFAVGWTPCIGVILGGILTLAATSGSQAQGAFLLAGYVLGLGLPFLALGVLYDRAPAITRPLVRHGRLVSFIGGMLVVAIGVAMLFDWLALVPRYLDFNTSI
jgi:cytochrome c-type biogenesis protein